MKKIATRESFGKALVELGKKYNDVIVLDADLAEATKTVYFKKEFPDRHIDCGIQEANMVGIAAGLAQTGKVPFCSSFAMFLAGRAYEQIRNSICYPKANVKLCATHAGVSVGEDGATHQCNEDIALMRVLPGMTVINPGDDIESRAAIHAAYHMEGSVYLRFGRLATENFNDEDNYHFKIGKGSILKEGKDITIIATGLMVMEAIKAGRKLLEEGIDAQIVNIHTIKPIDEELVIKCADRTGRVLTVEEHSIIGGLGSAVMEVLSEYCPVPIKRLGVPDVFGTSGNGKEVLSYFGLDEERICSSVRDMLF